MDRAKARLETSPKHIRIELEQHDQDFNYFELEYDGIRRGANDLHVPVYRIVEAGPFQNFLWKGKLIDGTTINEDCRPGILMDEDGEWKVLNYPVTRVQISPR